MRAKLVHGMSVHGVSGSDLRRTHTFLDPIESANAPNSWAIKFKSASDKSDLQPTPMLAPRLGIDHLTKR